VLSFPSSAAFAASHELISSRSVGPTWILSEALPPLPIGVPGERRSFEKMTDELETPTDQSAGQLSSRLTRESGDNYRVRRHSVYQHVPQCSKNQYSSFTRARPCKNHQRRRLGVPDTLKLASRQVLF
jgi:hypothetical protein